jgi:hypothetical protein
MEESDICWWTQYGKLNRNATLGSPQQQTCILAQRITDSYTPSSEPLESICIRPFWLSMNARTYSWQKLRGSETNYNLNRITCIYAISNATLSLCDIPVFQTFLNQSLYLTDYISLWSLCISFTTDGNVTILQLLTFTFINSSCWPSLLLFTSLSLLWQLLVTTQAVRSFRVGHSLTNKATNPRPLKDRHSISNCEYSEWVNMTSVTF